MSDEQRDEWVKISYSDDCRLFQASTYADKYMTDHFFVMQEIFELEKRIEELENIGEMEEAHKKRDELDEKREEEKFLLKKSANELYADAHVWKHVKPSHERFDKGYADELVRVLDDFKKRNNLNFME